MAHRVAPEGEEGQRRHEAEEPEGRHLRGRDRGVRKAGEVLEKGSENGNGVRFGVVDEEGCARAHGAVEEGGGAEL